MEANYFFCCDISILGRMRCFTCGTYSVASFYAKKSPFVYSSASLHTIVKENRRCVGGAYQALQYGNENKHVYCNPSKLLR